MLQHEVSIIEFCQWKNRFRAYYNQSNVAEQGHTLHHAFTCIDDNLADIIQTRLQDNDTFIYKGTHTNSIMQVQETYFDKLHPLHGSFHKLTSLEPGANQSASCFFSEFLRLADKVDASKITKDRLLLAIMTAKCLNKELRISLDLNVSREGYPPLF